MKNIKEFYENKILKLSNNVEDNMIKQDIDKQFQSFDLELENKMANNDLSVKNKNLANNDTRMTIISDNSFKDIIKYYLEVSL